MLIVLIAFILAVRVLAAPNYISAAIERAENYSGICLAIDSNCSVGADQQVHLEDHPSLELSLSSHLLAAPVSCWPLCRVLAFCRRPRIHTRRVCHFGSSPNSFSTPQDADAALLSMQYLV